MVLIHKCGVNISKQADGDYTHDELVPVGAIMNNNNNSTCTINKKAGVDITISHSYYMIYSYFMLSSGWCLHTSMSYCFAIFTSVFWYPIDGSYM